jgi:cytochrome c553
MLHAPDTLPMDRTTGTGVPSEDPLAMLKQGDEQLADLCSRGSEDALSKALCASPKPTIEGLADLMGALGLSFGDPTASGQNGGGGNPAFVLSGHSSSLVARSVSAMNPRAIVFRPALPPRPGMPDEEFLVLAFTRGDQFVEVAVKSPPSMEAPAGDLQFYLVRYRQACNEDQSCNFGDLLTPSVEKRWTSWTVYEDDDLTNTTFDCSSCHQPDGPNGPKILRMQELHDPWTHFFKSDRPGGQALLTDFHAAHGGDEDYGPIPAALIDRSDPSKLTDLLERNGFAVQPNEFKGALIEAEVKQSNPGEPAVNQPPGVSATWSELYARAVTGTEIAVPYHDVKVTDPSKLDAMTAAYVSVRTGMKPASTLPDIRDVFLDAALPDLSMRPKPGLDGRGILLHMCSSCHNARLDQTITRARFDVGRLDQMSRDEKDKAIRRLQLAPDKRGHMPPAIVRSLSNAELDLAVGELER